MQLNTQSTPAVLLTNVLFGWATTPILTIPSLRINAGQHLFLHGPSGCGKSSLLNLLAGIASPSTGSVEVLGTELSTLSRARRDEFRARQLGIIFQQFNLIPYLSVLDNLLLRASFIPFAQNLGTEKTCTLQALELLTQLGLSGHQHHKAQNLSVGQQQRVAVARALIGKPKIIIADEPTSALDADAKNSFMELLFTSAAQFNSTIIFVSHDTSLRNYFNHAIDVRTFNATPATATHHDS